MATVDPIEFPWRKWLRRVHLCLGGILCLPLAVLGITGSILVFGDELDDLLGAAPPRATAQGPSRPVEALVAVARAAAAGAEPVALVAPADPGDPMTVRLAPPGRTGPGSLVTVYLDPADGAVLDTVEPSQALGPVRQIFMLHASLAIPGRTGREVVGWLGAAMLALGVTGPILWWPRGGRWRAALTVKRGAGAYRLLRDLHGAVGIWTLAVFLVVSFTGTYLCFPQTLGEAVRSVFPARDMRGAASVPRVQPVAGAQRIGLDDAVALAQAKAGAAPLRFVNLPRRPDQPLAVGLASRHAMASVPGHGPPQVTVLVDSWRREVIEVRDPSGFTTGETILAWQHAIHAGRGAGGLWTVLVVLSGLLPVLFTATGVSMWWLKRRARRRRHAIENELQQGAQFATTPRHAD